MGKAECYWSLVFIQVILVLWLTLFTLTFRLYAFHTTRFSHLRRDECIFSLRRSAFMFRIKLLAIVSVWLCEHVAIHCVRWGPSLYAVQAFYTSVIHDYASFHHSCVFLSHFFSWLLFREFQWLSHLPVTGRLDGATERQMAVPRCGVKDDRGQSAWAQRVNAIFLGDAATDRGNLRRKRHIPPG